MKLLAFLGFLVLGILSLRGVRVAYITFVVLGILYFPVSVGFRLNPNHASSFPAYRWLFILYELSAHRACRLILPNDEGTISYVSLVEFRLGGSGKYHHGNASGIAEGISG